MTFGAYRTKCVSRWNIRFHPLIQPEGVRVPVVEVLPHDLVAPLRPSVLARRRGGADAEQEVDVRVGRHRGELLARRPRVPRMSVAPPEHRLRALGRRQPPAASSPPSIMSCRCAWSDRRSRGNERPSWAPLPKGYLTVPEKVIYRGNDRQPDTHSVRAVKSGHGI